MDVGELDKIYKNTMKEFESVERFHRLTSLAYDLAVASSMEESGYTAPALPRGIRPDETSFSPADVSIVGTDLVSGWVTLDEYSRATGIKIEEVCVNAAEGLLGELREVGGKTVVYLMPPGQQIDDLPPTDSGKVYRTKIGIKAAVMRRAEISVDDIVSLLGPAGALREHTSEASSLLNRETFLLYWSTFEQYVKTLTIALYELFPEKVFEKKKYANTQMTYGEIYESSSRFTSIRELKNCILDSILGRPGTEREAVSRQISFIQECYLERGQDPYETWCVVFGEKVEISYQLLNQIRVIRNALIHGDGDLKEDWDSIDIVDKPTNGRVVIDDDLLMKVEKVLESISFNLYRLIRKSE